jgi:hypothetical protein
MAFDRDHWRAHVNEVLNIRFAVNVWDFLCTERLLMLSPRAGALFRGGIRS